VKKQADQLSLGFFAAWLEMINLEQSAVNVYAQSNLMSSGATKQVKDDGLKLVKIEIDEESAGGDKQMASFIAYLERPYFDKGKKSGDIN